VDYQRKNQHRTKNVSHNFCQRSHRLY